MDSCHIRTKRAVPVVLTILLVSALIALTMCVTVRGQSKKATEDVMCDPSSATQAERDPALEKAESQFTYKGRPIHPKLVKQFMGWISDTAPPVVITVDVSAALAARSEYYFDAVQEDGALILWVYEDWAMPVQRPTLPTKGLEPWSMVRRSSRRTIVAEEVWSLPILCS